VKRLVVVLAASLLAVTGCSTAGGFGAPSAATVDGTEIPMSELYDDLDILANSPTYRTQTEQQGIAVFGSDGRTYTTEFVTGWLTVLVRSALIESQLESVGGEVTDADRAEAEQSYAQLRGSGEFPDAFIDRRVEADATTAALQRKLQESATAVTDEEVRAYYDANIEATMASIGDDVACVTQATALFSGSSATGAAPTAEQEAAARQLIDEVAGAVAAGQDFTTVATALADDPSGLASGGRDECFVRGSQQYPAAVEDAAYAQPVGEVGPVLRSDVGYHIVLVRSRGVPPFEELESQIRAQLESDRTQSTQTQVDAFVQEADIDVDPRFGTFDPETVAVVPPEGPLPGEALPAVDPRTGGQVESGSP
jgi:parvulin-like peptidyl-prolyl isomerase